MSAFFWIIGATVFVSVLSFIGLVVLLIKEKFLEKILIFFIALSAGALIGGAFFHLLPEAIEDFSIASAFDYLLVGFVLFFLLEKILHWRHCHKIHCHRHAFTYLNLIGGSIHNFFDGLVIAAAFSTDIRLGIASVLAIVLHEIPHEIGDFCVLLYGGFDKYRALFFNFLTALFAILGGVSGYFLSDWTDNFNQFLLPVAAGGFLYIGASDLIPELKKETEAGRSFGIFIAFVAGLLIMYLTKFIE